MIPAVTASAVAPSGAGASTHQSAPGPYSQSAGLATPDGSLYTLSGSFPAIPGLAEPVVGWAADSNGGAWEVGGDGGVFARGRAPFYGSTGGIHLDQPVVGIASTPDGRGYWLVASDGGVFSYGDARFFGSTGGLRLDRPVVGMAPTSDGRGYWLVASDGGVFSFGDARFFGSTGGVKLAQPIVGMAAAPGGGGYWLAGRDGGVFSFGAAHFAGAATGADGSYATVAIAPDGSGYDETFDNGEVWSMLPGSSAVERSLGMPQSEQLAAEAAAGGASQVAQAALKVALSEVGKPYVYGAAGPDAFDCSGLTQYAYHQVGIDLPRTAAEQASAVRNVPVSDLQPGDLLFFYPGITHVGMYVGNGMMVDAPHPGENVQVEEYKWFGPIMAVGRPA